MVKRVRNIKAAIMITALLVVTGGLATAFYLYQKGPVDVENGNAIAINAVDLYSIYSLDSIGARERYTDKILEVSGRSHRYHSIQNAERLFC